MMKLNRKWLAVGGITLALILAASIGGIAVLADNGTAVAATGAATTTTATVTPEQALLDKIVADYKAATGVSLDETALKNAITQAQTETRLAGLQTRLSAEVTARTLTQAQADQILAWYNSMPGVLSGEGGLGILGGHGIGRGMGCLQP